MTMKVVDKLSHGTCTIRLCVEGPGPATVVMLATQDSSVPSIGDFMHINYRAAAVALAALLGTGAASAAVYQYQFQTYYDGSTLTPFDTNVYPSVVAGLTLTDISGGVEISLKFKDTDLPNASSSSKMTLDRLWLGGSKSGTVTRNSGDSFSSRYYSLGTLTPELNYRNWVIDYSSAFSEGETSKLTIKGAGITASSLLANNKAPIIEIDNVGGTFGKWTSKSLRFIGNVAPIPEPSTYALMGLGLVGVVLVARRRTV
jgi:PEP-CTERM motif